MRRYLADAGALARKDLLLELRARDTLPAMLLFVIAVLVVFHFALPTSASADASLGLLWVAILFTALLGLGRSFVAEREQGVLDGLVLAPSDRSAIWVGKVVATLAFLVVAEIVALPAFALFFTSIDASTIAGIALADVGICAVGTVLAAMAAAGRARELLLPLLFLPLAIPIVVGGVGSSLADSSGSVRVRRHGVPATGPGSVRAASRRCSRASGQSVITEPSRKMKPASQIRLTSGFTSTLR